MIRLLLWFIPTPRLLAALLARPEFCGLVASWADGKWEWHVRRLETREDAMAVIESVYEQMVFEMPSRDSKPPL